MSNERALGRVLLMGTDLGTEVGSGPGTGVGYDPRQEGWSAGGWGGKKEGWKISVKPFW